MTTYRRDFIVQVVLDSITKNIPVSEDIQQTALNIYHQASHAGLVRGRSIEVVVSASLYAAIRIHKAPYFLEDIVKNAGAKKKVVGRMYRLLIKELDLMTIPINAEDTIVKLSRELKLKDETFKDAVGLLKQAEKHGLISGRNPMSVVAAVIYHSALKFNEKITQKTISISTGVTEATIRNRNRELEEMPGVN